MGRWTRALLASQMNFSFTISGGCRGMKAQVVDQMMETVEKSWGESQGVEDRVEKAGVSKVGQWSHWRLLARHATSSIVFAGNEQVRSLIFLRFSF